MNYGKKILMTFLLMTMMTFGFIQVVDAKEFPSGVGNDVNIGWKVKFNQQLQLDSLTPERIYVTDGSTKVPTSIKLVGNGDTVEVKPLTPYIPGKEYKLEITGTIKSLTGSTLKTPITFPFEIVDTKSPIQSIQHVSGEGLTNFTVKVSRDIHKTTVNGIELRQTGFNEFSGALFDLKPGSKVSIKTYNVTNKLMQTRSYSIGL